MKSKLFGNRTVIEFPKSILARISYIYCMIVFLVKGGGGAGLHGFCDNLLELLGEPAADWMKINFKNCLKQSNLRYE